MNKKLKFLTITFCIIYTFTFGQSNELRSSSNVTPLICIDSISDMKIDKILFFKNPIILEYYVLKDTSYIPTWYKTFCANSNIEFFKEDYNEAIRYFDSESGVSMNDLKNMYEFVKKQGGSRNYLSKKDQDQYRQFLGIYNEIWFTHIKSKDKFLVINGLYGKLDVLNSNNLFEFWENKDKKEPIDSVNRWTFFTFKITNDTIKWIPQEKFDEVYLKNKFCINPYATPFKKLVYRQKSYILSEVLDYKRIFNTFEKNNNSFKLIYSTEK